MSVRQKPIARAIGTFWLTFGGCGSAVIAAGFPQVGIVLSTHDPDHAFAIAGRVLLLHDGRVIADGPPREMLTGRRLEEVYGVPVAVEVLPGGRLTCVPSLT